MPGLVPVLNWSYIKPQFAGKPGEDAEVHLLRTNNWMDTHVFPEAVKVQSLCFTLVGEDRLWYESLRPIAGYWKGLQAQLRQQYSKISKTRAKFFYTWRSFHFL